MQTIAITPRWQIHLPVAFRKKLGIDRPGLVEVSLTKKTIIIKPKASPLLRLAGKYRGKTPVSQIDVDKIRESIDYSAL
ncbi:AbrB/MazE/SpoVT family DNA-binding domain-containing protein [Candidatus Shapirobacteria bacterium]|nr:AbrB/MazE/SpoVT family DNA-binding domain-containing protein [Candidatus Shapirobacteria bacterium]